MSGVNSTVSEHAIIQFSEMVHHRAQQNKARLRPWVEIRQMDGKAMAYDGLGSVEAQELNGRYAPVEFSDIEHFRRKITKRRFGVTLPIDETDIEERLLDPENNYADETVKAMERVFDRVVIQAMFKDVQTGEDFENTITAANDGVLTVDATGGLTYEKLLEISQNFIDNEVGNDNERPMVMGISGSEHTDLMSELELTSGDYSREYVVDKGRMQMATGISLIKYGANSINGADPMLPVSSGTRTSFCMVDNAMCVGLSRAWKIKVQDRNDLYDTKQVQITGVLGAVRTEGKLIQKVTTTA